MEPEGNHLLRRASVTGNRGQPGSGKRAGKAKASLSDTNRGEPHPIPFDGFLTNKLLSALPGPDFARLFPYLEPVSLLAGGEVYKSGELIDFVYFPENVVFSQMHFFSDGGTTGSAMIGNEGMLGLSTVLNSGRCSYSTHVTVSGTAVRAKAEVIRSEFARGQAMHRLLLEYTQRCLTELSQKAVCNGHHRLEERLSFWLLMVQERSREEQLPLTHEEIAFHLGARRAGITSSCNALRSRGTIEYRRGLIRILDREALRKAACECYEALSECSGPYPRLQ
jgi:CRP-like cAMP-binding protein